MPRTFIYKGPPGDVGRFGYLNTNDQVDLWLDEEICVMDSENFEALAEQPLPSRIVPLRARFVYDLRNIDWSHRHAASHLRGLSRHTLLNLLIAMNELGVEVDAFESMPTDDVVDNIRRAAKAHGWDTLTQSERLACPAASDEDADEATAEEDNGPSGESEKEPQGEKTTAEEKKNEEQVESGEENEADDAAATPVKKGPARKRSSSDKP